MGIKDALQRVSGQRWLPYPRVRLKAGDRCRFFFITDGADPFFDAAYFHDVEVAPQRTREVLCLKRFCDEVCTLCEDGHDDLVRRFAVWLYVTNIYHLYDNPDGPPWEQVRLGNRIFFKEVVEGERLLWLGIGRNKAWISQFEQEYDRVGNLRNKLYELVRVGSGVSDTDYRLQFLKEAPEPEPIEALRESLPSIAEVFRSTLGVRAEAPLMARTGEPKPRGEEGFDSEEDEVAFEPEIEVEEDLV